MASSSTPKQNTPHSQMKIIEVTEAKPLPTTESSTELTLGLTFYDTFWLRFPPVERLFFYELAESPSKFYSVTLPRLKRSLSHALVHYLPLCGRLTWPPHASMPELRYVPGDQASVHLTVAQATADFDRVSGYKAREICESFPYIPELLVSDHTASTLSLQITLFPDKGFCIGYIINHSILDGRGMTNFMKAWAFICRRLVDDDESLLHEEQELFALPQELTPVFDRTCIKDTKGVGDLFLRQWDDLMETLYAETYDTSKNRRNLKLLPRISHSDSVGATFELTKENLNRIKKMVLTELTSSDHPSPVLSTFALTCAFVLVCMVKARGGEENREVKFIFSVDYKGRVKPKVPLNYFGNCIIPHNLTLQAKDYMQKNGVSFVAYKISELIMRLENEEKLFEGVDNLLPQLKSMKDVQVISVAGSTRFDVYGTDFGFGRPRKMEITSIGRTGAISLADGRNGGGDVEVGIALPALEMEAFASFFENGLNDLE